VLTLAGGAECHGADMFRNIERCQADAAAGVVNQHRFIFLQSSHRDQQSPRREIVNRNRGGLFECQVGRLLKYLECGNSNQFRLPSEPRHRNYQIADDAAIDALTSGFDRGLIADIVAHCGWDDLFDAIVYPDEVPAGRPAPYLIFRAMEKVLVQPVARVAAIGDTTLDSPSEREIARQERMKREG